ncbi:unnamed protein product [Closterium sp. NIES-64]|nr:unnamed protein product [Closterium sp. NIES-64]
MKALDTAARPLMFPSPAHESSPASPPSSPPTSPSASSSSSSSPPFSLPAIRDRLRPFFLSPSNSEHLPVTRDDPHPYHPSHPPNHALALPRLRITPTLFSNTLLLLLSLLILLPLLAIPLLAPPSPLPPPTAAAQPAAEGSLGQEVGGEEDYGASGGGGIEVTDSDGSGGGGRDGSTGRMPRMPRTLVSRLLVICYDHRSLEFCSSLRLHCFLDTQVRVAKVWGMGHEALRGTLVPRLLAICYDHRSLEFCCSLRLHCFLDTQEDAPKSERDDFSGGQKKFMTPSYLHLNPLPHLLNVPSDLLIACDRWSADPKAAAANGGFYMAHSNDRVLRFFDYWLESHTRLPGIHDQDAFMRVRPEADPYTRVTLRLSVHYLPTESFSGFCEIGRQLGRLVTVHANCCLGLEKKMQVLQQVLGDVDWFRQLPLVDRVGVGRHGLSWSGRNSPAASPASPPAPTPTLPPASPSASSSSSSSSLPSSLPFLPALGDRLRTCFLAPSNNGHLPVILNESNPSHPSHHALFRLRITPTFSATLSSSSSRCSSSFPLLAIPLLAPPSPLPPPTAAAQLAAEGSGAQGVGEKGDHGEGGWGNAFESTQKGVGERGTMGKVVGGTGWGTVMAVLVVVVEGGVAMREEGTKGWWQRETDQII